MTKPDSINKQLQLQNWQRNVSDSQIVLTRNNEKYAGEKEEHRMVFRAQCHHQYDIANDQYATGK